ALGARHAGAGGEERASGCGARGRRVIARLRKRHRVMWMALLVVAPVVIAGARSVRRGEPTRQHLEVDLTSPWVVREAPHWPIDWSKSLDHIVLNAPDFAIHGESPAARRFGQIGMDATWLAPTGEEVLVYWSNVYWKDVNAGSPTLPADAFLLGAWPSGGSVVFPFPRDAQNGGTLLFYSLTRGAVIRTQHVDKIDLVWVN